MEVTQLTIRTDMTVKLMQYMGSDRSIIAAARVSTEGADSEEYMNMPESEGAGLINFLMKNRHGTPFEHNAMTFLIEAPIFVFREFHRHRIGWSYNEESARYKQLAPVFYIPSPTRPLVQVGKPGAYEFVPGTTEQLNLSCETLCDTYRQCYTAYETLMAAGVAKEVARANLPVAIYSSMYATCNARSLMAFLSLRTKDDRASFPSFPQAEINMVASMMESHFAEHYPITLDAYNRNGRVCP